MKRLSGFTRWGVALMALGLTPLLSACEEADAEFIAELALEWAHTKKLITVSCTGPGDEDCTLDVNYVRLGAYMGSRSVFGTTGDRQLDAGLDAYDVVSGLESADELARTGAAEGDLDKIDQAIEQRPEDWSYRDQRAAVLMAQGNAEEAQAEFDRAEALVRRRVDRGGSCLQSYRSLYRNRADALRGQLQRGPSTQLESQLDETEAALAALESGAPGSDCAGSP